MKTKDMDSAIQISLLPILIRICFGFSQLLKNFMELAFKSAEEALANQEVPVGCVFVLDGREVVANGRNRVNETKNACLHAEFVCLDQVVATHGRKALTR